MTSTLVSIVLSWCVASTMQPGHQGLAVEAKGGNSVCISDMKRGKCQNVNMGVPCCRRSWQRPRPTG
ncbi:hypothetical protein JHK82_026769 [Glycine max]|uniref:Secreted protein n=2 Tax=Glycine subgen. Soja TaxID=1462606 RepID=K7LH33_SOYBN|nr:hypothetical protein JHK85_027388 [Glycine max]KAG5125934.1 hypothetical protein JHK82_026769 [Glycine max]KAH1136464.1 hypothetical protein GYH30_026792 [Glycine max]KRH32055.1 hypothetical protein GLYMA_10G029200v4 [Glycine max]RZB85423.1 hypothetical protein D0Y65_025845 [Glycine soja]